MADGMDYSDFLSRKLATCVPTGIETVGDLSAYSLMPHQSDLVTWALRRGRAAVFADTGLGKTRIQLAWSDRIRAETGERVLILAPLAVAAQTVAEGSAIGVQVTHCREPEDVRDGINITNYDRLHKFDSSLFGAVVLDESSCIKHHDTKTLAQLLAAFRDVRFKLCATATPAPNDWTELGTHAEFLGICTRQEMLAEYFVHDGGETQVWRLKGHAHEQFWRWVAGWGAMVRKPSDLGHDDSAYALPPLTVTEHAVASEAQTAGMLFAMEAQTLSERRDARRSSLTERVNATYEVILSSWTSKSEVNTTEDTDSLILMNSGKKEERRTGQMLTMSEKWRASMPLSQKGVKQTDNQTLDTTTSIPRKDASTCERDMPGSAKSLSKKIEPDAPTLSKVESSGIGCCVENSESVLLNMRQSSHGKVAGARYAERRNQVTDRASQLIIATHLEKLGEFSARPATQELEDSKTRQTVCAAQQPTLTPQWVVWVDLNAEQDALAKMFGDLCVSIYGSLDPDEKIARFERFKNGEVPVLITKPSIFGYGINMQFSSHAAFVGVTDSFETYYQTIRRQWRFGQKREVQVHLFASELEGAVLANLKRKEADAAAMADALSAETIAAVRAEVFGQARQTNPYQPRKPIVAPAWLKSEAA